MMRGSRSHDVRSALPVTGPAVPAVWVRVLLGLVGLGVCAVELGWGPWFVIGALVAVAAALRPVTLAPWLLAGLLALHQLATDPAPGWRFAILLAGVHLLTVLGGFALALPVHGRLELRALVAPLRRFVAVQVPAQVAAQVVLWAFTGDRRPHVPLVAVAGAAALVGIASVGVARLTVARGRGGSSGA
jgi:hypothetical protein